MEPSRVDLLSLIREDRVQLLGFMERVARAPDAAGKKLICAELLPMLERHIFAVEDTLVARALREDRLRAGAQRVVEANDAIEWMASRLCAAAEDGQWEARVRVLLSLVKSQMSEDERDLLPAAPRTIPEAELTELGERYVESRQRHELAPVFQLPVRSIPAPERASAK